ncbi:MAG: phosphoribosyltransferase family protein [Chitinophagaceae bacterium]|nr:phosphoribosyltransferase family protein [Chitinophagaceae bacterium]
MMSKMNETKKYILNASVAEKKLRRIALEIIENNPETEELILAGIRDNGYNIAVILQQYIGQYSEIKTKLISVSLDKKSPGEVKLSENFSYDNKTVVLIDDVANSGKTMLYAMKPFLDFQPRKIQTVVLVGRSHNSFPIHPDYIGLSIATTLQEHIFVEVGEGGVTGAYLQ